MVSLVKQEKFVHFDAIQLMYENLCTDLKAVSLLSNSPTIDELPQDLITTSAKFVVQNFLKNTRGYKGHRAKSDEESKQIEKLTKLLVGYVLLQIDQNKNLIAAQKEMDAIINSILK